MFILQLVTAYANISTEHSPGDISSESFEMAASLYFSLVFCPDNLAPTINFYQNLFEISEADTILKSLARLLFVSKEKSVGEHYRTARHFLSRITETFNLQYKEVALMTSSLTQLQEICH